MFGAETALGRGATMLIALRRWSLLAALATVLVGPAAAGAQRSASETDSLRALSDAVLAMRLLFHQHTELIDRQVMQLSRGPASTAFVPVTGYCEIVVGQFCYGPENGGIALGGFGTTAATQTFAPAKLPRVFRGRSRTLIDRYLAALKKQLKIIPGDRYIIGEIVRMESDRGNYGRAMSELRGCRAEPWWCGALNAYLQFLTGDWVKSDSTWRVALAAMPESERCAWLDPTMLVDDAAFRSEYHDQDCAAQLRVAERFWWLSDPFYTLAGNERRSEHLVRQTALILTMHAQERMEQTVSLVASGNGRDAAEPMPVSLDAGMGSMLRTMGAGPFSSGLRRYRSGYPGLVLRAGVPLYVIEEDPPTDPLSQAHLIAQYPKPRYSFAPMPHAVADPTAAVAEDWELSPADPHEFMTGIPRTIHDLEFQAALFQREGAGRLLVATNLTQVDELRHVETGITLVLQPDYDRESIRLERYGVGTVVFDTVVAHQPTFASLEVRASDGNLGRVRFGHGPPQMPQQTLTLSDLLLLTPGNPVSTLEEARDRALGTTRVDTGSSVGLYWEVYGLAATDTARVSIIARKQEDGLLRRLGRAITFQPGPDALAVQWQEAPSERPTEARSLNLDISSLAPGRYTLSIAVEVDGQQLVESVRAIEVVER